MTEQNNEYVTPHSEDTPDVLQEQITEQEQSLVSSPEEIAQLKERQAFETYVQSNGQGISGIFPALAGSDIALNNKPRHIEILMEGVQGAAMASYANQLSEVDLAAVITYTRQAWGNSEKGDGQIVVPKDIVDYKL